MTSTDPAKQRHTDTPCGRFLDRAEAELGCELTLGQKTDLLLDNFYMIANADEAREIALCCELKGRA